MGLTPHGPGFSFLDSFEITLPLKQGRGRKWLDPQMAFFADHFPDRPLMPGVLLIECAAQAAGAMWASTREGGGPSRFVLAQVAQWKLLRPVRPGETVVTDVVLETTFSSLTQFGVTLFVDGTEVARGKLTLGCSGAP